MLVFSLLVSYTIRERRAFTRKEETKDMGPNQPNQRPVVQQRPVTQPAPAPVGVHQTNLKPTTRRKRVRRKHLVLFVTLVLLIAAGVFWSWWLFGRSMPFNEDTNVNSEEYQAVFLTNGQVYFGKLADLNHKYVTITDVYYLQVQQNSSLQGASSSTSPSSQVSLVKLGSELHGPQDEMYIASDQMLFWENLKSSGKVVQAINRYQDQ